MYILTKKITSYPMVIMATFLIKFDVIGVIAMELLSTLTATKINRAFGWLFIIKRHADALD